MTDIPKAPARKSPKVAYINFDQCTGCEACIAVAPHPDCISRVRVEPQVSSCEVVEEKCTGCTLCMKICPWDAIIMIPRGSSDRVVKADTPTGIKAGS
jgi:Na+-translocating ferredoxin:NAD+ oxidoreductase RNF subunit RnfB